MGNTVQSPITAIPTTRPFQINVYSNTTSKPNYKAAPNPSPTATGGANPPFRNISLQPVPASVASPSSNNCKSLDDNLNHIQLGQCADKHEIVDFKAHIAIDLGTDGCAIAFALNDKVTVYNEWKTNGRENVQKTKTQILTDDKHNVIAFGENAKTIYTNLIGPERQRWNFFQRFKMSLLCEQRLENNEQVSSRNAVNISSDLRATNGNTCAADKIFIKTFQNLKQKAMAYLEKLKEPNQSIKEKEIQWIITVPAIWNDSAKQRMREWAIQANLVDPNIRNQCRIVYECDCAAVYVRHLYHMHEQQQHPLRQQQPPNMSAYSNFTKITGVSSMYSLLDKIDDKQQQQNHVPLALTMAELLSDDEDEDDDDSVDAPPNATYSIVSFVQNVWDNLQVKCVDPELVLNQQLMLNRSASFGAPALEESKGDRYILVDAGGGTVDIVCHEVVNGASVKEIIEPTGGPWGADCVDNQFKKLLINIFGGACIDEFVVKSPNGWTELLDNFELAKSDFYQQPQADTHELDLPYEFIQQLRAKCQEKQQDLKRTIQQFSANKTLEQMFMDGTMDSSTEAAMDCDHEFDAEWSMDIDSAADDDKSTEHNDDEDNADGNGRLRMNLKDETLEMDAGIWRFAFDFAIDKIIAHLNGLLADMNAPQQCKWIYLVGGFSCSPYFQHRMQMEFQAQIEVIMPPQPTLSVVKGAAYFGLLKNCITARKSKFAYGIRVTRTLYEAKRCGVPKQHLEQYNDGNGKITHCFHVMIRKTELLRMNDAVSVTIKCKEKISDLVLLRSERNDAQTQNDAEVVGNFLVQYDGKGEAVVEFHCSDATFAVYTYFANTPQSRRVLKEIDY